MKTIRFANPMLAAQAVAVAMSSPKQRFSPRPWNQYEPDESLWWVVPSTEWPAFRHGKYIFVKDKAVMEAGLNIEKGFGAVTQGVGTKAANSPSVMGADWRWHSFLSDLSSGVFENAMAEVAQRAESELHLRLGISFPNLREHFDPLSSTPRHLVTFSWDAGRLELKSKQDRYEDYVGVNRASTIPDLADELSGVKSQDWYWIDFYAYVTLALPRDGDQAEDTLDAYDLIKVMEPWERWLGVGAKHVS